MRNLVDHAADLRRVLKRVALVHLVEPQTDERGALVSTNNPTDLSVRGRGMLPVTSVSEVNSNSGSERMMLTTTGSFRTDANGFLVSESGLVLMGWPANPDGTIPNYPRDTAEGLEPIMVGVNQLSGEPTTSIRMSLNLPATATEAGAFVILYSIIVGAFIYREITWSKLWDATMQSLSDIGMIMLIIIVAAVLGYVIVLEQAPAQLADAITHLTTNPTLTLLLILGFLVLAGTVMEATVNVLLLTPLFTPILVNMGFDPIHFGVLMVTIVTMGSNTPPIGVSMFTVCGMLDCSVKEYIRGSTPFLLVMLATFLLMALVPGIVTWLPNTAMGN